MSLILEALRKLERDRHTNERGFLVLAQPAWTPTAERAWTRGPALLGVAALAGGAVAAALLWSPRTQPAAVPAAAPVTPLAAAVVPQLPGGQQRPAAPPARVAWPEARVPAPKATAPPVAATSRERPSVQADPAVADDVPVADAEEPAPETAEAPETPPVTGPLRLEAIAQRDGQPVAVVSGQLVRVGDRIGAGTVVRIGVSDIEIETDGQRQVLRF